MGGMVSHKDNPKPPGPYQGYLNDRCVTIAEALKTAGYRTFMSGKWHVGEFRPHWPTDRGFDRYYGLISGAANYFDITKGKREGIRRGFAQDDQAVMPPEENFYITDAISDHAVECLAEHGQQDDPIFMYVAYTAPHWPLHALPEDIARYKGKYMEGWDQLRQERYQRLLEAGIIDERWPISPRDEDSDPWSDVPNKEEMDLKMAVYAAQIDRMDQGIGRIMDQIKANGQWENTLILFLADNGGWGLSLWLTIPPIPA
ncbi:Arylsulfatase [subsurface metagenome]